MENNTTWECTLRTNSGRDGIGKVNGFRTSDVNDSNGGASNDGSDSQRNKDGRNVLRKSNRKGCLINPVGTYDYNTIDSRNNKHHGTIAELEEEETQSGDSQDLAEEIAQAVGKAHMALQHAEVFQQLL